MFKFLMLVLVLFWQFPAYADATLSIYARAKNAKFIADYTGGALVTVIEKKTGRTLAQGITKGSTGDTDKIMKATTSQTITSTGSAFYLAILPIEQPTEIEIIVKGPLDYPDAVNTVSQTMWAFPDTDDNFERTVIIEIPGLIVTPEKLAIDDNTLSVTAQVRMLCGCELEPSGTWDSNNYHVWAELHNKLNKVATLDLTYSENSRFSGKIALDGLEAKELTLKIFATSKDHQNTGVAIRELASQLLITKDESLAANLDALMKKANEYVGFNGSLLVGNSDGLLYYNQIGFADREHKIPLTDKHLFSAGSIAKELTTVAIMKLVNEGKITYQDSVAKYLPDLASWANKVTIKQLMSHTSGLPRIQWHDHIETDDVDEQIKNIRQLAFEPGQDFLYGNLNIVLRASIVEAVTKVDFQTFLQQEIFTVADMQDSINPRTMTQHSESMVYKLEPNAISGMTFFTTPSDLYKFELALWLEKIVPMQSINDALPGDILSGSRNRAFFDFGRFATNAEGKLVSWEHDGSANPDHHALKFHDFERDLIIVLMSSDGNKSTLFDLKRSILPIVNGENSEVPVSWWFQRQVSKKGFDPAFNLLQHRIEQDNKLELSESDINTLGYELMGDNNQQAVRLFELNLSRFPSSANAYDSYGEALIKLGKISEAKNILKQGLTLAKEQKIAHLIKSIARQYEEINEQRH